MDEETKKTQDKPLSLVKAEYIGHELLPIEKVEEGLKKIREFQNVVKKLLVPELDYGSIPGTPKPTLLKPGAEKLVKLHGLSDQYAVVDKVEDWDKGLFYYRIECSLISLLSGKLISHGLGSCNSWEGKYRYRWIYPNELTEEQKAIKDTLKIKWSGKGKPPRYQIENDDIYTQVNTILKMAKKRALTDATLSACRLSAVFTQDIEDLDIQVEDKAGDKAGDKTEEKPKEKIEVKSVSELAEKITEIELSEKKKDTKSNWQDLHDNCPYPQVAKRIIGKIGAIDTLTDLYKYYGDKEKKVSEKSKEYLDWWCDCVNLRMAELKGE